MHAADVDHVRRRSTYEPLARWLADARSLASPDLVVVLVGNKLDRAEEEREVSHAEASEWARQHGEWRSYMPAPHALNPRHYAGALFLETSSLTGENVESPFILAARSILLSIENGALDPEKPGSGISYGDRALRRVGSGSRFSFADMGNGNSRRGGLQGLRDKVGGCC